jgi:alkylation response protein AidB-like acyl-CoA dehydrogenase
MITEFPTDRAAKRAMLLDAVGGIGETLRASGPKSEELATLSPDAVAALRDAGIFRMKLVKELGGGEVDPVTEMMVLEELAYHDLTSAWCTMVGATAIASLGMFLPKAGLERVFGGKTPTAAISFFPAGRAVREGDGYRLNGRWRFGSGIRHAEWAIGGTIVEGSEAENGGRPTVIFSAVPMSEVKIHDNWGGVTGLRGTGSCDFSVENAYLPKELSFSWDLLQPKPLRGGPSCLFPPFSYVAKEHASVAVGSARRALDELITIAMTTRGTFRVSKLAERQTVHRFVGEADLKIRAVRALMHQRYQELYDRAAAGSPPDGPAIADVRAIALYATEIAIEIATAAYHFSGNTGLHHPHVLGRLLRDLNTAGIHQVVSDTAWENHGKYRLGLPSDPYA